MISKWPRLSANKADVEVYIDLSGTSRPVGLLGRYVLGGSCIRVAERAGISSPHHELLQVAGKPVRLSRRFDRAGRIRIPFLSAMSMTGSRDGQRGSYPELVDALTQHGAKALSGDCFFAISGPSFV